MKTPDDIIAECLAVGRVCPQPQSWSLLWNLLPDRRRLGNDWEPPLPLILAAWSFTSDSAKLDRFMLHLKWAESRGAMDTVTDFLDSLKPCDWYNKGEN